jgi:hypothetical protein
MRFLLGVTMAGVGVLLLGIVIVVANGSSPPEPVVIVHGPDYNEPASTNIPAEQHEAPVPEAVSGNSSEDHTLHEDGRIYSVALIDATPEIPVGEKVFAQGRLENFDYASGMRSRPFAIVKDEQQPERTLLCAMTENEGAEVVSLYRAGEVVSVSGTYMATAGISGYPPMPILSDCRVAGSQNNVVRPDPNL